MRKNSLDVFLGVGGEKGINGLRVNLLMLAVAKNSLTISVNLSGGSINKKICIFEGGIISQTQVTAQQLSFTYFV